MDRFQQRLRNKLAKLRLPRFPHPTDGQLAAVSPAKQAPLKSAAPSSLSEYWDDCQRLHETSVKVPVKAPRPDGKKAEAPPVSSQISKLLSRLFRLSPCKFSGRLTGNLFRAGQLGQMWFGHTIPFPYRLSGVSLATFSKYIPRFLGQGFSGSVNSMFLLNCMGIFTKDLSP